MFRFFRKKSASLADTSENEKMVSMVANHVADFAIQNVETLQRFIAQMASGDGRSTQTSKRISAAAFRFWVFELHLILKALLGNAKEHSDRSENVFVKPIYSQVYEVSKTEFFRTAFGAEALEDFGDEFDSVADTDVNALLSLPLANENVYPLHSSAVGTTIERACVDLQAEAGDLLVHSEFVLLLRAAQRELSVWEGLCNGMRKNMRT